MSKRNVFPTFVSFIILMIWIAAPSWEQDLTVNRAWANLALEKFCHTDQDVVENVLLDWTPTWMVGLSNYLDGGPPISNPRIEVITNLNITGVWPWDPNVYSHQQGSSLYVWDFGNLALPEPAGIGVHLYEPTNLVVARPRFRGERRVAPEILVEDVTLQTTTFTFTLEEPIPPEVNSLWIAIGHPLMVYQDDRLVETSVVSWTEVEGWHPQVDGYQIIWHTFPPNIEIGRVYQFQVTLENTKRPDLLIGSPLYKPPVQVSYKRSQGLQTTTGNSYVLTDPGGQVQATASVTEVVEWVASVTDSCFSFIFDPVISELTLPPPPFYVLIPAEIRIEPEVINLKSKGRVKVFVQLPEPYRVENINQTTVTVDGTPTKNGVLAGDMLILDVQTQALNWIEPGDQIEILVSGELLDGSLFRGTDTCRIIQ